MSVKSMPTRVSLAVLVAFQVCAMVRCTCIPNEYREFENLSLEQQHEQFRTFPIEKQFDIYMYHMKCIHPPDTEFTNDIAARGDEAVPFLMEKLTEAQSERDQIYIIGILRTMSILRYADLRKNPENVDQLVETVASMRPFWRGMGERGLWFIEEERDWEDDIAANGEEAIPSLKLRLEDSSGWLQLDILRLFRYMCVNHYGDFRDNPELMIFLEDVVASMEERPTDFRELGERQLQQIREECGISKD
jgi:hypothetical protein